ncbi:MAG: hypothetical protein A2W22_02175 [Candidatus Levybacteria bacterium RBG_16_35_11]|nr:MAG: hypothetical protein A2W22_02175 [Candidatus Levybacteria bacterium RBG_16_35_11]
MLSLPQIIEWLLVYKYIVLFPIMVIEGPIITIIAGFFASLSLLNIYIVYIVILVADLTGDVIYYSIGRWGRESFLDHYGKYLGLKKKNIERVESHFEKHRKKTLIAGKLSHAVGAPILVAAGIAKVPFFEFLWLNAVATLPKALAFLLIGYYFGQAYVRLNKYLDYISLGFLILGILFIIFYFGFNRIKGKFDKLIRGISKN